MGGRARGLTVVGILALLLLAGAVVVAGRRDEPARPRPAGAKRFDPGPALDPLTARLPVRGIAVEVVGLGVVAMDLEGQVIGHFAGFNSFGPGTPGPLVLRRDDDWFLLDSGRLQPLSMAEGRLVTPLAYRAEQAREDDGERTVVRRDGRDIFDLGDGFDGEAMVANDLDVVSVDWRDQATGRALDLRSGETWTLPPGCLVADRHGARRYLACGEPEGEDWRAVRKTIRVSDGDGAPAALVPPAAGEGQWQRAMVSPDGTQLLLGWRTAPCITWSTFLAPTSTGKATPIQTRFGSTDSGSAMIPLGWAPDGRAFARMLRNDCREDTGAAREALYAVDDDGVTQLAAFPEDISVEGADMWAPAID